MISRSEYMNLVKKLEKAGFEKFYTSMADNPKESGSLWVHKDGREFFWNYKLSKKDVEKIIKGNEDDY
ncbi:MAG: hypothetical protein ACOCP4_00835 [Candidatus Woesearchaeota archaeon]